MRSKFEELLSLLFVWALVAVPASFADNRAASDWQSAVIYQIVTDRFADGDPNNNDPPQSKGLFDSSRKNWQAYWGGDLAGITEKIEYLRQLRIGAVWISPAQDCVNRSVSDTEVLAPYHGYWPRDFKRVDEHFGDASNSWQAFDRLASALHRNNMRLIIDFVPNHTSPLKTGEHGALYDDGKLLATPQSRPDFFHIAPTITDWNNPDQLQHWTIFDLADLNQSNPQVSSYLLQSAALWQKHGADGFRIDSMKHINWDWLPTFTRSVKNNKAGTFVVGEWFQASTADPTYKDSVAVANESGMSELDYPLSTALRSAFGTDNASFKLVEETMKREDSDYKRPQQLVTFLDNHDIPRFLNIQPDRQRLHQALVFLLTSRGIPCVYYGTEQYLVDTTNGGKDPYDRPMMPAFEETPASRLIASLASLRASQPALSRGETSWLVVNSDVCCYVRKSEPADGSAGNSPAVVVAINKSKQAQTINASGSGFKPGQYTSVLKVEPSVNLTVLADGSLRCNLPADSAAVWVLP